MPLNKSKRMAARQAQLSGRSRHARSHGPSGIPLPYAQGGDGQGVATVDSPRAESAAVVGAARQAPQQGVARQGQTSRPGRARVGGYVLPPQAYFGAEMRHIGITLAFILAVLIILTIWLR